MAKITELTRNDFIMGHLFTLRLALSERFFLIIPKVGLSYIVDGFNKQTYAYVESVHEDSFIVNRLFFGRSIKLEIKFSECFKIID